MTYSDTVRLKNGSTCLIRNPAPDEAEEVLRCFLQTHAETEFLATYPDETRFTPEDERAFLSGRAADPRAAELGAYLDGTLVGTAGIEPVGAFRKVRHRASFGISVEKAYWSLGIGRALTLACVACAERAVYQQLELEVVADNLAAVRLYESVGFVRCGANPLGFRADSGRAQELVMMRLSLPANKN